MRKRLPLMKWRTISTRARRCWKHLYQLALIDPKLELKERHAAAMTPEQKKIWKRELDEANRTAEKCGNVRMVETMFDRNLVRRMESAGELLNGWKQEYRKML